MSYLITALYLGWSLGANDAANIFGTAVSSKMVRFTTAIILSSIFVILGSIIEGKNGIETISSISAMDLTTAGISSLAAAISVTIMTMLKLPVSTSQAVVGSIVGVGIMQKYIALTGLGKILVCWIGTPIGACIISMILYLLLAKFLNRLRLSIWDYDFVMRAGLIITGCYGAYALGANNVANVTAVFYGAGLLSLEAAALIGGASIALGILTFSKGVMNTVGKGIVKLDAYSAFIVVLSNAITVHIYAGIGVPVSTSQAVVGAILGIGLLKRAEALKKRSVVGVFSGWIATPIIAALFSVFIYFITHLKYVG
ncbi:MAG: inorganic phosphate transporter [Thermodesulfobacteriota bacterium]|nr:inorganic phosphate transporter [Thermodesulfobacteriota bacterium]